jgi:hypothetical protein
VTSKSEAPEVLGSTQRAGPSSTRSVSARTSVRVLLAWWKASAGRNRPEDLTNWEAWVIPALAPAFIALMVIDLLVHPLFLGVDSAHNYAHIWFISQQIFHHGRIPLRIALVDGGRAVTFPYGFVPYIVGAVLYRLAGDWAVSFLMAVALLGTVWAAGCARPAMRDPWFIVLFIINPFFIDAVYAFQFATLWATLFFFLFVWAFEGRRHVLAAVLLWLTVSTHPIMGALAVGAYGAYVLVRDRPAASRLALIALPAAVALVPIYWMMLLTPSVRENSFATLVKAIIDIIPRRGSILAAPFLFTAGAPLIRRFYRSTLVSVAMAAAIFVVFANGYIFGYHGSYYGALHGSSDIYADFFKSPTFHPGATYRVLEPNEREDGMYRFIQHGAVLSSEWFSESMFRRNWEEPKYRCLVAYKKIDYVVYERMYQHQFRRNEQALLGSLAASGRASLVYRDAKGRFSVYDVRRFARERPRPASLHACGLY